MAPRGLISGPVSASPHGVSKAFRFAKYTVALAIPGWAFWRLSIPMLASPLGYDEQVFVWSGWSILKGLAPYRDFMEWKPPLAFLTHALALKLFGMQGLHFRYFFLLLSMASILALVASLIKGGADVVLSSAFGLAMVHLFLFPGFHETFVADTESIGAAYYYLGIAALIANTRFRRAAEIAGGILLTCCALSKEPFMPCVVATWASCYFVVHRRFSRGTAFHYFKYTTIGVGAVVAALSLYMVPTGAMSAYLALVRRYATMFSDPQTGYCVLLGSFKPTGRLFEDLPVQWRIMRQQFINPATLGFLVPFWAASLIFLPRRSWALLVSALVAMTVSFYGVTMTHCFFPHYYIMGESGMIFFLAMGVDALGRRLSFGHPGTRLWAQSAVFLAMAVHVWPRIDAVSHLALLDAPRPAEPAPGLFDFVHANSGPADKIFTTGPPALYVLVDRLPAVKGYPVIDELIPAMSGGTDEEKLRPLYEQLLNSRPKIVFLDPENGHRKRRHLTSAIMPFLSTLNYVKVNDNLYKRD